MSGIINVEGSRSGVIGGRLDRWKQYTGALSGGDFAITGSVTVEILNCKAIPYQLSDGVWRFRFNFDGNRGASLTNSVAITLGGVTFKSGHNQAIAGWQFSNTTDYVHYSYAQDGSSNINVRIHGSASRFIASGDVELDSKPTWAD